MDPSEAEAAAMVKASPECPAAVGGGAAEVRGEIAYLQKLAGLPVEERASQEAGEE